MARSPRRLASRGALWQKPRAHGELNPESLRYSLSLALAHFRSPRFRWKDKLMNKPVRKAVFPVGGLGTRFLPATKAIPKEMLPVVDKPLIQHAFEEARAAGIEEFIFVTGRSKTALEDHFDHSFELEATLGERGKTGQLAALNAWMPEPGQ